MQIHFKIGLSAIALAAVFGAGWAIQGAVFAQAPNLQTPATDITLKADPDVAQADQQTRAIVEAATAYLATLSPEQRAASLFDLADNTQRANWSNFPDGPVQRMGIKRGDMTDEQLQALNTLLRTVLSDVGYQNIVYQLAAEDSLGPGNGPAAHFGSEYYYVSFLGTPSVDAPWMFQFGGHHLAINVTVAGRDLSFSPMLTGGEPLHIDFEDQQVFITEVEVTAAQALMNSLSDAQKDTAIQSSRAINLLLGPGAFGTTLAPEGLRASDMSEAQHALLLDLMGARLGFINADDYAAKMAVAQAEMDDTYFGWWGPELPLGAAYFRVTAPSTVLEYAPQSMGGDPADHAHNMYRDPSNDYGSAWIAQ